MGFVVSATLTGWAIYWVYDLDTFRRWNWIRVSLLITVISTILPTVFTVYNITNINQDFFYNVPSGGKVEPWTNWTGLHETVMVFLFFMGFPLLFLAIYPSPEALGLHSDRNAAALLISWNTIHLANYSIQSRCHMMHDVSLKHASIWLVVAVVVTLLSGWLGPAFMSAGRADY